MPTKPSIEARDGATYLRLRLRPAASRDALEISPEGHVRAAVTAPPVDGAANRALLKLLSKTLGVPRNALAIVRGEKSRDKTIAVHRLSPEAVCRCLGGERSGKENR